MDVMITVDVEAWPRLDDWRETQLFGDLQRDVYGCTPDGEFGVRYQAELLRAHGLKGVFFVEALFACEVGVEPLAKMVEVIQAAGSEVQLHIHTEWFEKMSAPFVDARAYNIRELEFSTQVLVINKALSNLREAGAKEVIAYRAGNFGASNTTLRALRKCGLRFDSSYNYCYLAKGCGIETDQMLVQPAVLDGMEELPVSCFRDYPGHYRPAQLCAITAWEMQAALSAASEARWNNFVIVSHSFEMLRDRKQASVMAVQDRSVVARFEALCEFLANHRDRFQTRGFCDLPDPYPEGDFEPLHLGLPGTGVRTLGRYASQALRRLPGKYEERVRGVLDKFGVGDF